MPRACCVPECKSNCTKSDTTAFLFPKDQKRRDQWMKAIPRQDFTPTSSSVVCVKHFATQFVLLEDRMTRADGTVITAPRGRPGLTKDAYPSIFPDLPKYLSKDPPKQRTSIQEREKRLSAHNENVLQKWYTQDSINSFDEFCVEFKNRVTSVWMSVTSEYHVTFFRISCEKKPEVTVSFKVLPDLTVTAWHGATALPSKKLCWLLGSNNKCDMWSKFESLISHLSSYHATSCDALDTLDFCVSVLKKTAEEHTLSNSLNFNKIWFCAEQLSLILQSKPRYSSDFLLWAVSVFYSSPSCYKGLRESGVLTLPHPNYLRKLSLGCVSQDQENSHNIFLKETIKNLKDEEKVVNVLLDEIHIKKNITYKGGKLHGMTDDSSEVASTLQAFMISSVLSSDKHVVALYPVCNLTADKLFELVNKVLQNVHNIGYKVISIISDNNRINRNMFQKLCGGNLASSIPNPFVSSERIFLLFDTVHLLKSIRNNWLNPKNPVQTFILPSVGNFSVAQEATMLPLKELYSQERRSHVKLAPGLSEKVLFPTNLERQNVKYAVSLFDDKNVAALKLTKRADVCGVIEFLEQIISWWNIVNVKTPTKGRNLRREESNPVRQNSSADPNLSFLKKFSHWLEAWETIDSRNFGGKPRAGKLSSETYCALKHTTVSLIDLCDYLFEYHKLQYVLLGKFQTDNLEARFGQYRQMSGGNYNVSVAQVFESEKKLKIMNYLSLKSGTLKINNIDTSSIGDHESNLGDPLHAFEGIGDLLQEQLSKENVSVLIYIAGYIAHSLQKKLKCSTCGCRLSSDKNLDVETPKDESQYLKFLDRGGLKWPTEFTLSLCSNTFKIFETLLTHFKENFLSSDNQRNILIKLSLDFHAQLYDLNELCPCGNSLNFILLHCIRSMTNVLLNNFAKSCNNDMACCGKGKKRKLSTLNK